DSGQFDINMQNDEGYTLLHFASGAGNLAMVDALLARGADPTIRTGIGQTPLDQAIGTMVSARLRRAEAEWKAGVRGGGATPAAAGADFDKVRWNIGARRNADAIAELDKGIDINMQTSEGYTLLHYAAGDGNLEMVRELLRRGANPNLRAQSGFTPLDSAIGTMVQAEIRKAGGRNAALAPSRPATSTPAAKPSKPASAKPAKPASSTAAAPAADSPRRKMCNQRHYSSSALCSDSTCKMREYRKWQTCLKTGSYY
ncbi:MAG TPA: ankyrin repeat domain-containing protein, partial [Caulobacteraceae bacterium]|nr:ankyrin repeat domain-containing protein [Caulobacteraceae bacterium]